MEECLAKEVKPCPDPFGTATLGSDPFAAFSLPSTVASDPFGGNAFSGKPSDLSSFDPFGGSSSDPFKVSDWLVEKLVNSFIRTRMLYSGPVELYAITGSFSNWRNVDPV